jgi:hypothetical protein
MYITINKSNPRPLIRTSSPLARLPYPLVLPRPIFPLSDTSHPTLDTSPFLEQLSVDAVLLGD